MIVGTVPCGAATSQSLPDSVINNQVQLGDVFATQTLDVETVTDQTVGESHGSGTDYLATAEDQNVSVLSNQMTLGNVTANTWLNVAKNSGAVTSLTTTAVGNAGEVGVTGAVMTAVLTQNTGAGTISAYSEANASSGQSGNVDSLTQSQGNSHVITVNNGTAGIRLSQDNGSDVTSGGGGVYGYVSGQAQFQAVTASNDITYVGTHFSGTRMISEQTNHGLQSLAAQFTAYGQVQEGRTITSAVGNSVDATNQGFLLDASIIQNNHAYVRSQAETSAASFGSLAADARGTANNIVVGDLGGEIILDSTQINDGGGVDVVSNTTGGDGYDAYGSASASGNAVVGYACAECNGRMTISNDQTNSADVGASTTMTITGSARSVKGVANAAGNTATYYVRKPGAN